VSNADGKENLDDLIAAAEGRLEPDSQIPGDAAEASEGGENVGQVAVKPSGPAKPVAKRSGASKPVVVHPSDDEPRMNWYILKVAFNREDSIRDALDKRVRMEGMEEYFGEILVPTEDLVEFTRAGKRRIVKRKLLPGYLMVNMIINDDTWFLVRETGGISDFTGAAGKPMPMDPADIERFVNKPVLGDDEEVQLKTSIPFKVGDRVRVKEGNFQNQEGEIDGVDEANGRITVIINIFGRSVPMELDHWQVEDL
jgi:transcription termination/antitermination protein NusG